MPKESEVEELRQPIAAVRGNRGSWEVLGMRRSGQQMHEVARYDETTCTM